MRPFIYGYSGFALASQEFAGPYPPQSQVQGTMKGQSIQSMFMEALQTAYLSFAKNLTVIRTDTSIANQRRVSWKIIFYEVSCNILQYCVQSSLSNTTADTLLDAKDKIFVRVITAQAPNKIAGSIRLSYHGMLTTPLAFDCSANEMASALLELPSFVANITAARRGPSLVSGIYMAIVSDVSMERTISPLECYGQDLKGVRAAVYVTEINPHSLNYGLRMSSPLPGIANGLSRASNTSDFSSLFAWQKTLALEGMASDLSTALYCGLEQYLPPPSWYGSAYLLIEVSVVSGSLERSTSTFKFLSIDVVATNSPPSVRWRNVLHSSNSSIPTPAAMVTVDDDATVVLDRNNNATLGSVAFIDLPLSHCNTVLSPNASSDYMWISLSVLFRTISIARNILNA